MPMREWLHRSAWELGRTLAGYEVLKVLAALRYLGKANDPETLEGLAQISELADGKVHERLEALGQRLQQGQGGFYKKNVL